MGDLSNAMQSLVGDIKSSAESRHVMVSEMRTDAHNLLERFHLEHQDMADALREKLSSDKAALIKSTRQFMSDVRSEHQDMADALREKLSSDKTALIKSTQQFMDKLASDHRGAQEIWRTIAGMVEEAAPQPVVEEEAEEEVTGEAAPQPVVEEEAEKEAGPAIEDQVLEAIARHSEGIKLVDIGNELGVDWRGLIGVVKSLGDEGRIEKIDNLYYPKS